MKVTTAIALVLLLGVACAKAAPVPPPWSAGAEDCASMPREPLQVQRQDARTFILRQDPCASFEANFLYLLIGNERALLIDSGAIADPARMPLATRVMALLPGRDGAKLPLVVAHTHSHLDHREGDAQFAALGGVEIVPADVDGVRAYYGFDRWPDGTASLDLGGRIVQVVPAPGHNPNHVVFFDEASGLLFTGDFLLPGRLLIDDLDAYQASAMRVAAFVRDRAVTQVLGGHVEMDVEGNLYPYGATYHPRERALPLAKSDVLALPQALADFNGFYARHGNFVLANPIRNLAVLATGAVLVLGLLVWALVRFVRRWRRRRVAPST
jgi:glyoxylase-like metal-dependent hydrolase (beta-lactamase superfamily II)